MHYRVQSSYSADDIERDATRSRNVFFCNLQASCRVLVVCYLSLMNIIYICISSPISLHGREVFIGFFFLIDN